MLIALYPLLPSVKCEQVVGCSAKRLQHMKRLLATAIALSTLGALPAAAETALQAIPSSDKSSVWLVLVIGNGFEDGSLTTLPMKSMDQCEEQGAIWISSNRTIKMEKKGEHLGFECLEGK